MSAISPQKNRSFQENTSEIKIRGLESCIQSNTQFYCKTSLYRPVGVSFMERISNITGYVFRDVGLLKTSLTHRSMLVQGADKYQSNERLEFLGDAVLEMIVRKFLFSRFPYRLEGDLSQLKEPLVNQNACFQYACKIDLQPDVLVSDNVPMENDKTRKKILADAFEALLGAIFFEGGYAEAEKFVLGKTESVMQEILNHPPINWKQRLQESLQKEYQCTPHYQLIQESDLGYLKSFEVSVFLSDTILGNGVGFSKKEAEQEAAKQAIENLEGGLDLKTSALRHRILSIPQKVGDSEQVQSLLALDLVRQLISMHQKITGLLKHINLETSGLSQEEQAFLKAQQHIPAPRKKVTPIMLIEGKKKLVPTVVREMIDRSHLSLWTREIFARIQSNDNTLSVHFLNETLKDRDLEVLAKLLEKNTILHHLYLTSLSIGEIGIRALKRIILFNKTLTRLTIHYSSNIEASLFQMVYTALKVDHNKTLLTLTLQSKNCSSRIDLTRHWGGSPFDLKSVESKMEGLINTS